MKTHHIIIIPGLGDPVKITQWAVKGWEQQYHVRTHVKAFGFTDQASTFETRLRKFADEIESMVQNKENCISLIGTSAGASAAINLWKYLEHRNASIDGAIINVCGRIRSGAEEHAWPSLKFAARKSPIFYESVRQTEKNINSFSARDLSKILTFRALFDETVPISTTYLEGATNIRVPMIGHVTTIATVMKWYAKTMIDFISK